MPKLTHTWKQTKGLSYQKRKSSFGLKSEHGVQPAEFETIQTVDDEEYVKAVDEFEKRHYQEVVTSKKKDTTSTKSESTSNNVRSFDHNELNSNDLILSSQRRSKRLAQKAFQNSADNTPPPHYKQLILQNVGVKPVNQTCHREKDDIVRDPTKDDKSEDKISICIENASDCPSHQCASSNNLLSYWDIPAPVLCQYQEVGITEMFEWQVNCLNVGRVLSGENLVYSAPTSAGKTLVAEILMLKCIFEQRRKALIILPFVSVTQEKMHYLRNLLQNTDKRVGGYMGNRYPPGGFSSIDIAVCTIEKANSLINKLIEDNELNHIGIIVVDELHMVGDSHRGYLLELLLTKIRYLQERSRALPCLRPNISHHIQIVGMSATLPNLNVIAHWLSASLFCTDYRPVPLTECLKIGSSIFRADSMEVIRTFSGAPTIKDDNDHVVQLCIETVAEGHGIIVFCPTKAWCETLAETIAKEIFELGKDSSDYTNHCLSHLRDQLRSALNGNFLCDVLDHLKSSSAGLDKLLARTVSFGVAFHHAGLTFDERGIIENSFRQGIIRVLVATSTLSSGVNLPARRVIIRTLIFHGSPLNVLSYNQMAGRAGRKGLDQQGESFLICKESERNKACTLIESRLPPVESCLIVKGEKDKGSLASSLKRAILEIIVSGIAVTPSDVQHYSACTLLAASVSKHAGVANSQNTKENVSSQTIEDCIDFLVEHEFICLQCAAGESDSTKRNFIATSLGRAVLASSLSPDDGLEVFQELEIARRSFVLENDLHLIYLVVPIYIVDQWTSVDWSSYLQMWEMLPMQVKRVGQCVGVEEPFLVRASQGLETQRRTRRLMVHLRFHLALALFDLINEVPLQSVADKFSCNRGMLQSLQQSVGTFAGMVTVFCHHLGWTNMELLLTSFQNRLYFGVQQELCELVKLSYLNGQFARALYDAGYQSLASLANASARDVGHALKDVMPFERGKKVLGENKQKSNHHSIWFPGTKTINECDAALLIIEEAREVLLKDLGVKNIEWTVASANPKANVRGTESEKSEMPVLSTKVDQHILDTKLHEKNVSTIQQNQLTTDGNNTIIWNSTNSAVIPDIKSEAGCSRTTESCDLKQDNAGIVSNFQNKADGNTTVVLASRPSFPKDEHSALEFLNVNSNLTNEMLIQKSDINISREDNSKSFEDSLVLTTQLEGILNRNVDVADHHQPQIQDVNVTRTSVCSSDSDRTPSIIIDSEDEIDDGISNSSLVNSPVSTVDVKSHLIDTPLKTEISDSRVKQLDGVFPITGRKGGESSLSEEDLFDAESSLEETRSTKPNPLNVMSSTLNKDADDCIAPTPPGSNKKTVKVDSDRNSVTSDSSRSPKCVRDNQTCDTKLLLTNSSSLIDITNGCPKLEAGAREGDQSRCKFEKGEENVSDIKLITENSSVKIVDINVCVKNPNFKEFVQGWRTKSKFSLCFAGTKKPQQDSNQVHIGSKFTNDIGSCKKNVENKNLTFNICEDTFVVDGLAVCWESPIGYYLKFCSSCQSKDNDEARQCDYLIKNVFEAFVSSHAKSHPRIVVFDAKEQLKLMYHVCGVLPFKVLEDPKVACWLLDPELDKFALYQIVETHLPQQLYLLKDFRDILHQSSIGIREDGSRFTCRLSATTEAVLSINLMECLMRKLEITNMIPAFIDVEMKCLIPLLRMELNGFGFRPEDFERHVGILKSKLKQLEHQAFSLVGHPFCLSSPNDVAKVLYAELKLPTVDGILDSDGEHFPHSKRFTRRAIKGSTSNMLKCLRRSARSGPSTKKDVLHKLEDVHSLPKIVIEWRQINNALTKIVFPIQKRKQFVPGLEMYRVYSNCNTITATGRVIMNEPNIQLIPKDFVVELPSDSQKMEIRKTRNTKDRDDFAIAYCPNVVIDGPSDSLISLRSAFIPFKGGVLIAADYSQLELRILAHLSQDTALLSALNSGQDVFKAIAARWKSCTIESVTDAERQQAKQICYGMIYGMGTKALGDTLVVDETEASLFMDSFKSKYPGIQSFTQSTVNKCRKNGYVETLLGRRRYLPEITSNILQAQSHAERQALNTTIQGSAADVVKQAMILIDKRLANLFLSSAVQKKNILKEHGQKYESKCSREGFLVLQLHDELVYEVFEEDICQVAKTVKRSMEECVELSVKLTVRIKVGPSWGELKEMDIKTLKK